ncbi:hypothetical protein M5E82_20700 [Parabacteroides distasonis]|nr:hypothetical protein M5E82_20700 [Parabacteroides distasonis]
MKKLILFVLCALSGLVVSAQSRWGLLRRVDLLRLIVLEWDLAGVRGLR